MELSILLAEQIVAMFFTMAVGYVVVKIGLFRESDSKVLSNVVVYICSPCVIIDSFQIEMTQDKVNGLLLAFVISVLVHIFMIGTTALLDRVLHFNAIEKASIIYSNCGYLIIPLVRAVLGSEWVFYTTAFIVVQTVLIWTHGIRMLNQGSESNYKEILLNPNIIAMVIGILLFAMGIRLPSVIGVGVSSFGNMISPASMLVIGMVIGKVNLGWVFTQKRPYLICFIRLIFYPVIAAVCLGCLGRMGIHEDAEYILMIVLLATAAPAAAMITQLAQIHNKDVKYASVINVMSVIFCIVTMPLLTMLYEVFF
ncbi:MAG: AEC family transporter [Dorea sp.]|jgi:predicted permease|nr:AEC family transporter [Dorea sp.]